MWPNCYSATGGLANRLSCGCCLGNGAAQTLGRTYQHSNSLTGNRFASPVQLCCLGQGLAHACKPDVRPALLQLHRQLCFQAELLKSGPGPRLEVVHAPLT